MLLALREFGDQLLNAIERFFKRIRCHNKNSIARAQNRFDC
jgi:hypothetical protein